MADFITSYNIVKEFEGGWCNEPQDSGGETYAGIARNFFGSWEGWRLVDAAKSHSSFQRGKVAFTTHLKTIPELSDMVTEWYRKEWWNRMGLEQFSQSLADEIFEQSINLGRGGAGRYLQRLCNAYNYNKGTKQPYFNELKEDGVVGSKTLTALTTIIAHRSNDTTLVHALNCLQGTHYLGLAAKNTSQRVFVDGWMKRTHNRE